MVLGFDCDVKVNKTRHSERTHVSNTQFLFSRSQVLGRHRDMDVFAALCICLNQVNFLKVMDSHFQIPTDDLDVYDDFIFSCACNGVSVLLVRGQRVRNDASCC